MSSVRNQVAACLLLRNLQQSQEDAYLCLVAFLSDSSKKKREHRYWEQLWLRWQRESNSIMLLYKRLLQVDDNEEFRLTLRMPPALYHELLQKVTSLIAKKDTRFRKAIPPDVRLAITMRYLSLGDRIRSLHQQFGVGLTTVGPIIRSTCIAIHEVLADEYFKMPSTKAEWEEVEWVFRNRWNLAHCIGALDGKHVRVQKPFNSGSLYWNYKKFYSVILMALVDENYMFRYVSVGSEGRASDGGVWRRSLAYKMLHDEENPLGIPPPVNIDGFHGQLPYFFIGDDAFALEEHLMKPYPGHNLSARQRVFNYRISRARRIVENVFGILAAKFRIFRQSIEMQPDNVSTIVMACCALHNYCRVRIGNNYLHPTAIDSEDVDHNIIEGLWRQEDEAFADVRGDASTRNPASKPKHIRHQLANYFCSFKGQLPWQYRLCHVDQADCDVPPE